MAVGVGAAIDSTRFSAVLVSDLTCNWLLHRHRGCGLGLTCAAKCCCLLQANSLKRAMTARLPRVLRISLVLANILLSGTMYAHERAQTRGMEWAVR